MDCAVLMNIKNSSKNRSGHGLTGRTECYGPVCVGVCIKGTIRAIISISLMVGQYSKYSLVVIAPLEGIVTFDLEY